MALLAKKVPDPSLKHCVNQQHSNTEGFLEDKDWLICPPPTV